MNVLLIKLYYTILLLLEKPWRISLRFAAWNDMFYRQYYFPIRRWLHQSIYGVYPRCPNDRSWYLDRFLFGHKTSSLRVDRRGTVGPLGQTRPDRTRALINMNDRTMDHHRFPPWWGEGGGPGRRCCFRDKAGHPRLRYARKNTSVRYFWIRLGERIPSSCSRHGCGSF